jgi:nucleoside-diphosphate-sugar epimerase
MMLDIDCAALKAEMARHVPLASLVGLVILMQRALLFGPWGQSDGALAGIPVDRLAEAQDRPVIVVLHHHANPLSLPVDAIALRNPQALRPWQHVLDPLAGYMTLAERLYASHPEAADAFNFGPDSADQRRVCDLLDASRTHWPVGWRDASDPAAPHEAGLLALTTDKARQVLGWRPRWGLDAAVARTIGWYRAVHLDGADPVARTSADIAAFEADVP